MVQIIIKDGEVPRTEELTAEVTSIGRGSANAVVIRDPSLSREHAEIRRQGDACTIVDLGSRNGTFVNGVMSREHSLQPGDRVELGNVLVVFDRELPGRDYTPRRKATREPGAVGDPAAIAETRRHTDSDRRHVTPAVRDFSEWHPPRRGALVAVAGLLVVGLSVAGFLYFRSGGSASGSGPAVGEEAVSAMAEPPASAVGANSVPATTVARRPTNGSGEGGSPDPASAPVTSTLPRHVESVRKRVAEALRLASSSGQVALCRAVEEECRALASGLSGSAAAEWVKMAEALAAERKQAVDARIEAGGRGLLNRASSAAATGEPDLARALLDALDRTAPGTQAAREGAALRVLLGTSEDRR